MSVRSPLLTAAMLLALPVAANAAVLTVTPGASPYPTFASAVAAAKSGDTIQLTAGTYKECAVIGQSNLTVIGLGAGAIFNGVACAGKAALVIDGANDTLDNLTFENIAVPDLNGAGIRMEGGNLTVTNARFYDNEEGILTYANPNVTLSVSNSVFMGNGICNAATCDHGIYAGQIKELYVVNSTFFDQRQGHHIKSRALTTEVVNSIIEDGPTGTASYSIDAANGGNVYVAANVIEKGPEMGNPVMVTIGEEGVTNPTKSILVTGNLALNDTTHAVTFVRNTTTTKASLSGNKTVGNIAVLSGPGTVSP